MRGALIQIGPHAIDRARWDWDEVERNPFFCPDAKTGRVALPSYLDGVRKAGSSVGAVIEVVAEGVPAGLGAPVYGKLDGDLAGALMGINAVKGVEIGAGFAAAALSGEDNADEMRMGNDGKPRVPVQPRRRHPRRHLHRPADRGALCGQADLVDPARRARPSTATATKPRSSTKGRHDPCVGIRAVPVGEAMVACVLADHYLRHRGQVGERPSWPFTAAAQAERTVRARHPSARRRRPIAAFARGEIVVVTDDDDRENEGDLFVAASLCTPEKMAFIIRHTSGIVCAPLSRRRGAGACISIRWWRRTTRRSAPPSPSRSTSATG